MSKRTFKILAIDGGGIRGIYPAKYLAELEADVRESIRRYFDLITGTSTGGIIAIALGLEIPASHILELYKSKGASIFGRRFPFKALLRPKYRNDALIEVLKSEFGERRLGDSKCRLCIPAVDLSTGQTKVYKTPHHNEFITDWRLPAWKVAAATSAAPVYFPAFSMEGNDAKVDGGLWANNPSLVGVAEALFLGYSIDKIKLLSIGTGEAKNFYMNPAKAQKAGLLHWGLGLINLTISVQSQAIHNQLTYILKCYKRINSPLPYDGFGLDDVQKALELEPIASQRFQETAVEVKREFFADKAPPWKQDVSA